MWRKVQIIIALIILIILLLLFIGRKKPERSVAPEVTEVELGIIPPAEVSSPVETPAPEKPLPTPVETPTPEKPLPVVVDKPELPPPLPPVPAPIMEPPKVEIHEELIPEDIEIVRFYYSQFLTGPASKLRFDINGSGFTQEFERMITVNSGHEKVKVENLALITLNQIAGTFVIESDAPTVVVFPQVLIGEKVVFQAPDPFGVIRPGEVLNLAFTSMAESGRSGKFRVYTNLTQAMLSEFKIWASTKGISFSHFNPQLPFIVDAQIDIGFTVPKGNYDMAVKLKDAVLWERKSIIRIVTPNVGQSGLVQRLKTLDGFYRPGDQALLEIQGSGFQPRDVDLLMVEVEGFKNTKSSFSYVAPGRLNLLLEIPKKTDPGPYAVVVKQEGTVLLRTVAAFQVVGENWTRSLSVEPKLKPGQKGELVLKGRALKRKFIKNLEVAVDEADLIIGRFKFVNKITAKAPIEVGPHVRPGDYWIKITSQGQPVKPHQGSIIRIHPN